jgi:hypothetical protein
VFGLLIPIDFSEFQVCLRWIDWYDGRIDSRGAQHLFEHFTTSLRIAVASFTSVRLAVLTCIFLFCAGPSDTFRVFHVHSHRFLSHVIALCMYV